MESTNAIQLASIMSVDTPTVVQISFPSVVSIKTRTLAAVANVATPVTDSLITLASALNRADYWKEGRTADRLGISGMNVEQLKFYARTGERVN